MREILRLCALAWLFALGGILSPMPARPAVGQDAAAAQTVKVPMRDGVALSTDLYMPEGAGPFPTVLVRTPYNKAGIRGFGTEGARRGYAVAAQDIRGRFASEGENLPFAAEGWGAQQDGWDTVEWVARQPWCNGKIGTWGGSALGIAQLLMAGTGTRRVAAQYITVGAPNLYGDMVFPGGVFKKGLVENWLVATSWSPEALSLWSAHPRYDDYWRERDLTRRYDQARAPAVHVGGWYDLFAQGTIDAFNGYHREGGRGARGRQKLLMGPWAHAIMRPRVGEVAFRQGDAPPGRFHNAWTWFDHTLRGEQNGVEEDPAVTYYVMGDTADPDAPGNAWRTADRWPPVAARSTPFYFHADRSLTREPPAGGEPLEYRYDPNDPAPTVGGPQLSLPAGPLNQAALERRPDVLAFTSEPLMAPLEVTGRVRLRLAAASDGPDTDFMAKLCDVYPDGRSFNVCEGQLRARFREGFRRELPLRPGRVTRLDIDLGSTSIIFNRGHRLRVLVTSSSAPAFDPNPNTGAPFRADSRTRVARNRVYVDSERRSFILLPVASTRAEQKE